MVSIFLLVYFFFYSWGARIPFYALVGQPQSRWTQPDSYIFPVTDHYVVDPHWEFFYFIWFVFIYGVTQMTEDDIYSYVDEASIMFDSIDPSSLDLIESGVRPITTANTLEDWTVSLAYVVGEEPEPYPEALHLGESTDELGETLEGDDTEELGLSEYDQVSSLAQEDSFNYLQKMPWFGNYYKGEVVCTYYDETFLLWYIADKKVSSIYLHEFFNQDARIMYYLFPTNYFEFYETESIFESLALEWLDPNIDWRPIDDESDIIELIDHLLYDPILDGESLMEDYDDHVEYYDFYFDEIRKMKLFGWWVPAQRLILDDEISYDFAFDNTSKYNGLQPLHTYENPEELSVDCLGGVEYFPSPLEIMPRDDAEASYHNEYYPFIIAKRDASFLYGVVSEDMPMYLDDNLNLRWNSFNSEFTSLSERLLLGNSFVLHEHELLAESLLESNLNGQDIQFTLLQLESLVVDLRLLQQGEFPKYPLRWNNKGLYYEVFNYATRKWVNLDICVLYLATRLAFLIEWFSLFTSSFLPLVASFSKRFKEETSIFFHLFYTLYNYCSQKNIVDDVRYNFSKIIPYFFEASSHIFFDKSGPGSLFDVEFHNDQAMRYAAIDSNFGQPYWIYQGLLDVDLREEGLFLYDPRVSGTWWFDRLFLSSYPRTSGGYPLDSFYYWNDHYTWLAGYNWFIAIDKGEFGFYEEIFNYTRYYAFWSEFAPDLDFGVIEKHWMDWNESPFATRHSFLQLYLYDGFTERLRRLRHIRLLQDLKKDK